jgi:hypothetical protein
MRFLDEIVRLLLKGHKRSALLSLNTGALARTATHLG